MASNGLGTIAIPASDRLSPGPLTPPTPPGSGLSFRSGNPLSSKVTSVLSSSYADSEFRDALSLLDARNISNSAETRRQLRLDVQHEVIESNGLILSEFGKVAEQLRRIGATIDKLNRSYDEMKSHVVAAHDNTSAMLQESEHLMKQRQNVETKQQLLKVFQEHFVLSEDEEALLTLTSEPVDDRFFAVLAKAKKIRSDCEVLLGFENQTLGLDVMEQTSKNLNHAFQKLYRWIQKEFKTLNLENPQINASVRRALRVLAERPSLFENVLDFFAEAREQVLSDAFYLALTGTSAREGGKDDPTVKPIELVAHDPLRYVGDMLAWTHSAAVSEREALEVLFVSGDGNEIAKGIQEGRSNELWQLMNDEEETPSNFDAVKALNELVDRDVSGAARILRQRVEQVIQSNEDTILAYKLANLLSFYLATFAKLLGSSSTPSSPSSSSTSSSVLLDSITNLETEALRQFRSLMRDHIATLQTDFQSTPLDLGPPDFLSDALKQLTSIMQTYEISMSSPGQDRESDFEPILSESFDPFLSGCENMAKSMSSRSEATADAEMDAHIFLINCLIAARTALEPFDFTRRRLDGIIKTIQEHADQLMESQYGFFRAESGLDGLVTELAPFFTSTSSSSSEMIPKLRALPTLTPESLTTASQNLDDFLPSALMDAMENLGRLQDSKLAREMTEEAAERFCVDFEHVEGLLELLDEETEKEAEEKGGFGEGVAMLREMFPRTTGEIRVLLS